MKKIMMVSLAVLIGIGSIGAYEVLKPKLTVEEQTALNNIPVNSIMGGWRDMSFDQQRKTADLVIRLNTLSANMSKFQDQLKADNERLQAKLQADQAQANADSQNLGGK